MSLCGDTCAVRSVGSQVHVATLKCRSWPCEDCGPRRRRQLKKLAVMGEPSTFITLTVNPAVGSSPAHRARMLADAWRVVVRRTKALRGYASIPYLCVFEATRRGEPHLHILARVPWIDQKWLSAQMQALIGAPIVDIRRLDSPGRAAAYVAKYVGKAPGKFGTSKRYWRTRDYAPEWNARMPDDDGEGGPWVCKAMSQGAYVMSALALGFWVGWEGGLAILTYGRPP